MTESQRHQLLLEMLQQTGFVTVEQVIDRLQVSPATARRDINKLGESGKLKKVRNGAEAVSQNRVAWTPMNIHQAQNHEEKVRIARAASQLVKPGESIVINCGSTAFTLGREICGKDAQVITNYLPLANFLIEQEHDSVVIMGANIIVAKLLHWHRRKVSLRYMRGTGCSQVARGSPLKGYIRPIC